MFRIPVAATPDGRLVAPEDAGKGSRYDCPACGARVDLHAGEKKRRHFHHRSESPCVAESVLHLSAKRLVAQAVEDWLDGRAEAPVFVRRCASPGCERTTTQTMPKKVARAAVEHRLRSGHVADIALLARAVDVPVALVEIRNTHAVDDAKAFELGIPWLEVSADQVCRDGGTRLVAVRDRLVPWLCAEHATSRGVTVKRARVDRERAKALARRLDFREGDYPGYEVSGVVACPRGHDAFTFAWKGRSPPDPRPPWLVARERSTRFRPHLRRYVAICPTCGEDVIEPRA